MAFDTVAFKALLKDIVEPEVKLLKDQSAVLYNLIDDGEARETTSKGVRIVAQTNVNASMRWFEEGGRYPLGGQPKFVEMLITYSRYGISGRLTRDVLEHSNGKAIVNLLTRSMKDDTVSAMKEFNQQMYEDGSGRKAVVLTRDSGTQVTFAAPFGARRVLENGLYQFYAGTSRTTNSTPYVIGDSIGATLSTASSKNNATGATIFDAVHADIVAGDIMTYENSYGRAIHGLNYIISNGTGTYQNVSRATYPQLRAIVDDAATAALTVARLNKLVFMAKYLRGNTSNSSKMMMISSPTQVQKYASLGDIVAGGLTTIPENKVLDLGYTAYKFSGMTWMVDVDCPDDTLYFVDLSQIKRYVLKELSPVQGSGTEEGLMPIPSFDSAGNGAYRDSAMYTMTAKFDIGCADPQSAGMKIINLSTSGLANGLF